jgi:signal transduction histidine kinase
VLDDLGLVAALEWLATSFQNRTGLPCELTIEPSLRDAPVEVALATTVFRGAQELLTNVMRHARASKAGMRLTVEHEHLVLTIHDDGCGLRPEQWKEGRSLGLRGLHERVKLVGGAVKIVSAPEKGTEVTLSLPTKYDNLRLAKEHR